MTFQSFPKPVTVKKKRKGIRKVGKRGKMNIVSNGLLKELFGEKGILYCEVQLKVCAQKEWLSFAHRHKRRWYYGKEHLLSDITQVLLVCVPCHQLLEQDAELTEKLFLKLRGTEL